MFNNSGGRPQQATRDVFLYIDSRLYAGATQHIAGFYRENSALYQCLPELASLHAVVERFVQRGASECYERPLLPLQRCFEVAAYTTPGARAVNCKGQWLTYGELDAQADALALHLQHCGLKPGKFCLIDLAPSIAQIRATLAVLKAGAACMYLAAGTDAPGKALGLAVMRPAMRLVRDGACAAGDGASEDLQTICCNEDAPPLPYGWPEEQPIDAHTPASAHVVVSAGGDLQLHLRTHVSLSAGLEPWHGLLQSRSQQCDPDIMWRPLSTGASYKLST